jgi:hypothetical protein
MERHNRKIFTLPIKELAICVMLIVKLNELNDKYSLHCTISNSIICIIIVIIIIKYIIVIIASVSSHRAHDDL